MVDEGGRVGGGRCDKKCLDSLKKKDKDKDRQNSDKKVSGDHCKTLLCQANNGDLVSIIDLIIPTNFGWRSQLEFGATFGAEAGYGVTVTIGWNFAWNRTSNEFGMSLDGSFEPIGAGLGPPFGGSVTGGPLVGWGSSTVDDVLDGDSYIASVTASPYPVAGSAAATAPMESGGRLHVDPVSGIVPATLYIGGGVGIPYASAGGGISHSFGSMQIDLNDLFP